MNNLKPLTSDVWGSTSNALYQGMQKAQEWGGHAYRYLKQTPEMLAQHPIAAISVIAVANTAFFFLINAGITGWEKRRANPESNGGERSYKQILISDSLAFGSSFAFNYLLSNLTKSQFDFSALATLSITTVFIRHFYNWLFPNQNSKKAPEEEKVTVTSTEKETDETIDLEDVLPEVSPQKVSPQKPSVDEIVPEPVAPPVSQQMPENDVEVALLNKKIAEETARANRIQSEKSKIEAKYDEIVADKSDNAAQIASLKADIAQLQSDKKSIGKEKDDAQAKADSALKELDRLEKEGKRLDAENASLKTQLSSLNTELQQANTDRNDAEKTLANVQSDLLKTTTELSGLQQSAAAEKDNLKKKINLLNDAKKTAEELRDVAQKDLEEYDQQKKPLIADLESKKSQAEQAKDQALSQLAALQQQLVDLNLKLSNAEKETLKITKEKECASDEKDNLEEYITTLEKKINGLERTNAILTLRKPGGVETKVSEEGSDDLYDVDDVNQKEQSAEALSLPRGYQKTPAGSPAKRGRQLVAGDVRSPRSPSADAAKETVNSRYLFSAKRPVNFSFTPAALGNQRMAQTDKKRLPAAED